MHKKEQKIRIVQTIRMKSTHQLELEIKQFLAGKRKKENINFIIRKRPIVVDKNMIVEYSGERIVHASLPFFKRKWSPKEYTIIKVLSDIQYLQETISDEEKRLKRMFGCKYSIEILSSTMQEDGKNLLILLATKQKGKRK